MRELAPGRPEADLARAFLSAMIDLPVRCAEGGHAATGIYQPYRWCCGSVAACGASAAACTTSDRIR
jgi:hypothetical protein